jgi:hypothetical protein
MSSISAEQISLDTNILFYTIDADAASARRKHFGGSRYAREFALRHTSHRAAQPFVLGCHAMAVAK